MKELSDKETPNNSSQNKKVSHNDIVDNIINLVINKYSTATGAVATFLVKDTAIEKLVRVVTLEEAEAIWIEHETFVMDKIYEYIKKNIRRKRY